MARVIVHAKVFEKLSAMVAKLHSTKYFGKREQAQQYVNDIANFIETIPDRDKYATKRRHYGAWYSRYKPNRNTTWYITFDVEGENYVVKNVINNHTREYPIYIRGRR